MKHVLALLLALPALALAQGALTPTAAPAPTMRTLDQLDARTPLGTPGQVTTSTVTIDQPGSYVLVGDITVSAGDGIALLSRNVTLDLNGFTISSTATTPDGCGIKLGDATHSVRAVRITNGRIRSGTTYDESQGGLFTGRGFLTGIGTGSDNVYDAICIRIDNVVITGIAQTGIYCNLASRVSHCQVRTCGGVGISAPVVSDSQALECFSSGIVADTVYDSTGHTVAGYAGIQTENITINSRGIRTAAPNSAGYGLFSRRIATGCLGSDTSTGPGPVGEPPPSGVVSIIASFCQGTSPSVGVCGSLSHICAGDSPAIAVKAGIAVGCSATGGGYTGASDGRYLMP
jgi:hypothetical protein